MFICLFNDDHTLESTNSLDEDILHGFLMNKHIKNILINY